MCFETLVLLIVISLISCQPTKAPNARTIRSLKSADARYIYLEIDADAGQTREHARIETSGFGLMKVPCEDAASVYDSIRLGVVDVSPSVARYAEWRSAEIALQKGEPGARQRYEALKSSKKLASLAALRLADLDLLAGRLERAERGYSELKRNAAHDVETIARATLAEIALRRGDKRELTLPSEDESLSAEAAYRVARALALAGRRDAASAVLTRGTASRVIDIRNLAFAKSIRADEVRERYLGHDDLAVVRLALRTDRDDLSQIRPLLLHSLLALDAGDEVLRLLQPIDYAALPIAALAIDAEIDMGLCDSARTHLLALGRSDRLASRLNRLKSAAECRKGVEQ